MASFATWRFVRAGQFNLGLLVPFVIGAVPCAFLAGRFPLAPEIDKPIVAAVLLLAGLRLLWPRPIKALENPVAPHPAIRVAAGAGIGTLSGLTGTGGGIFLSPLILLLGGKRRGTRRVYRRRSSCACRCPGCWGACPPWVVCRLELPWFVAAVAIGALVGTRIGVSKVPNGRLLQLLGLVLLIASAKMAFT